MFGLSAEEVEQIVSVLKKHQAIKTAIIFGSRAISQHKKASDIDIALKGKIDIKILSAIRSELNEETTLPYFIDVVNYQTISNSKLKAEIDRDGKIIYQAKE